MQLSLIFRGSPNNRAHNLKQPLTLDKSNPAIEWATSNDLLHQQSAPFLPGVASDPLGRYCQASGAHT
ncbi:hypothetical protein BHE74_00047325 [Ensete ventricosum]|nr:hypothetical protein BHE74_00047325 [Ensete ventricosum]RZS10230.1 hypothetical protein BHM03_00041420 [Ensete ventricosum]